MSQNDTGRAFEYGIAVSLSNHLPAILQENSLIQTAKRSFEICSMVEQENIVLASREAIAFLMAHDERLSDTRCSVYLQSDHLGKQGDVRDVIIHNASLNEDIGISAKNRHFAVKHSRLSDSIDFGSDWLDIPCSSEYLDTVIPIFQDLRLKQQMGSRWRDIPNKMQVYYLPILRAFQKEFSTLFQNQPVGTATALVRYLLGKFDYYKIVKENGSVSITSFNIGGTLRWGNRLRMPTRLIEIALKPKSYTTVMMTFDEGWQISFRIHSASTLVEPSLKFDINLIGTPKTMRHDIHYRG